MKAIASTPRLLNFRGPHAPPPALSLWLRRKEIQRRKSPDWRLAVQLRPRFEQLDDKALLAIGDLAVINLSSSGGNEASQAPAVFVVSRDTTQGSLTVNIGLHTSYSNATASDFSSTLPTTVVIPDGESSATFSLTPARDNLVEGSESLVYQLESGSGYTIGTSYSSCLILDDPPVVSISGDDSVGEGSATARTFTVHRTGGDLTQPLPVEVESTGSAVEGTDFTSVLGASPLELVIPANETSATFDIEALLDNLVEGSETAEFAIVADSAHFLIDPQAASAGVSILDDVPTFTIAAADNLAVEDSATEPDTGRFVVEPSGGDLTQSLSFTFTIVTYPAPEEAPYFATSGTDYTVPESYSITIPANETTWEFFVTAANDELNEGDELVTIALDENTSSYSIAGSAEATVVIDDNDEWTVGIVALGDGVTSEGGTSGQNAIYRTGEFDLTYPLTVSLEISQASTVGSGDHDFTYRTYEIPAGETYVLIDVQAENDGVAEEEETLIVGLLAGDLYTIDAESGEATLTLVDNDQWTVDVLALASEAFETEQLPGEFLLVRSGQTDFTYPLTVNVAMGSAGTATSGDYNTIYGSYEIPAGAASVVVSLLPHGLKRARDVTEQTMLNRIVFRAARRVMGHLNVALQIGGEFAQILLEPQASVAIAAAAVAEQQHFRSVPVMPPSQTLPPPPDGIAGQFARVRTTGQVHKAFVAARIVHAVRHQPLLGRDKVVVAHDYPTIRIGAARVEEIAEDLLRTYPITPAARKAIHAATNSRMDR